MADLLHIQLEALRKEPYSIAAANSVRALASEKGAVELYANAFELRGDQLFELQDLKEAVESWIEASLAYARELQHFDKSKRILGRVLDLKPDDRRAFTLMAMVLYDLEQWDDLIHLYQTRLSRSEVEGERTSLYQYIADLLADKKSDPDKAFEILVQSSREAPLQLRTIQRLEALGATIGRLTDVAIVMGDVLIQQPEAQIRAAISLRMGEMHLGPLKSAERALVYLRSALLELDEDPSILQTVDDFFVHRTRFDGLVRLWSDAVQERRIGSQRVRLERELAYIYRYELGQPEHGFRTLIRILQFAPQDRDLIEEVIELGEELGHFEEVFNLLKDLVDAAPNPLWAKFVELRLESLQARRELDDEFQPTNEDFAGELGTTEVSAAASRLSVVEYGFDETGDLSIDELSPDFSVPTVTSTETTHMEPLLVDDADISEVTVASMGRTESELKVLERNLAELEGNERGRRCLGLAQAWRQLGDEVQAERLLREGLRESALDVELLEALADLLYRAERWQDWLDVAEHQLERDLRQGLELRLQMADVAERHLNDTRLAERLAEEGFAYDPQQLEPLLVLERLSRQRHDYGVLVRTLRRMLALRPDDAQTYLKLAQALQKLGQREAAAEVLRTAPQDIKLSQLLVLRAMVDVQLELGEEKDAEKNLELLTLWGEQADRAQAWSQLARLQFNGNRVDAARASLDTALHLDAQSKDALALAVEQMEYDGDPGRASVFAEQLAELEDRPLAAAGWFRKAAELADYGVGDRRRALRLYQQVLALDTDDPAGEARIGELLLEDGQLIESRTHLLRAAHGFRDELRAAFVFCLAGEVATKLGQLNEAFGDYQAALTLVSNYQPALTRASQLAMEVGQLRQAYDYAAKLMLFYETNLGPSEKANAYLIMARGKLADGDLGAASRLAHRAEQEAPREPNVLRLLSDLLEAAGDGAAASELLRRLADVQSDTQEKARTLARAAGLLGSQPADEARRIALLEMALHAEPTDKSLALSLAEAYAQTGDIHEQARALDHASKHAPRRERAQLQTQVGELLRTHDRGRSLMAFRAALDAVPDHTAAAEQLQVMLAARGDQLSRVDTLERAADSAREEEPIVSARWRLLAAQVAETQLLRPERALSILGVQDESPVTADLLFRAAMGGGGFVDRARRVWAQRCVSQPDDSEAFTRLASLHHQAGDNPAARYMWELSRILFGVELPAHAPPPQALSTLRELPNNHKIESNNLESELFKILGYTPLEALTSDIMQPAPKRKDVVLMRGIKQDMAQALREVSEAFEVTSPDMYWGQKLSEPVCPGWAFGRPCILLDRHFQLEGLEPTSRFDIVSLRFFVGRTFALLRSNCLALHLLPVGIIRALSYGLAELSPRTSDPINRPNAKRKGRAVAKFLPSEEQSAAAACAYAWLTGPRRSLCEAREALHQEADQWGLLASGSPYVAARIVSQRSFVDRQRLLRFAIRASAAMETTSTSSCS